MLSRPLLATLCILPLFASPAYTQTAPTVAATPSAANMRAPQNLRAALSAFGLNRPSRELSFTKGPSTADSAQFSQLAFRTTSGETVRLDTLTIMRNANPGTDLGRITIEGTNLIVPGGSSIARISLDNVRGRANLVGLLGGLTSPAARSRDRVFIDKISMSTFSMQSGTGAEEGTTRVAQLELTQVELANDGYRFGSVGAKDGVIDTKDFVASFSDVSVTGIAPEAFTFLTNASKRGSIPFDLLKLSLDHLSLDGLTYNFKIAENAPVSLKTWSLGRFSFDNMRDGMLGQFTLADMKFAGNLARDTVEGSLGRLNMTGINLVYFAKLGEIFERAAKSMAPKTTDTALASQDQPASAASVPDNSLTMPLGQLLKGGPLDSGIASLDFGDLKVSAAGGAFTIDKIALTQVRDANNIIVKADMAPTTMRLVFPESFTNGTNPFGKMIAPLLSSNAIALRFRGEAGFTPETDVTTLSNYELELVNFGKMNFSFAASGFSKMLSQLSFDDILKASTPQRGAGPSPTTAPAAALKSMLDLYKEVKLINARAEIVDLGGLDVATRFRRIRQPGNTPPETLSPSETRAIRQTWGQSARTAAGDKKQPQLSRSAALSFARWVENGGSLVVDAKPPIPMSFAALEDPAALTPSQWGLSFNNRVATRP
jgi:hypothetical protein